MPILNELFLALPPANGGRFTHTHTHTHTHARARARQVYPSVHKTTNRSFVLAKTQVILITLSENMRIKIVPPQQKVFFIDVNCDLTFLID
jgi:hypothetical protein